jgi:flagellar basal body-associated protein FliL
MSEEMDVNKKSNTKKIAIVVLIVALLAVIAVLAYMILKPQPPAEEKTVGNLTGGRGTVATPDNIDEIMEKRNAPVEDGYFETDMNIEWNFPSSKKASVDASVGNSVNNSRKLYFEVFLKDSGQMVYSSPYVPVGTADEKFKLDADLPKGTYPASCVYHLVDDNNEEVSTLSVDVTINIAS